MIKITDAAVEQIRISEKHNEIEGMPLRIAATRTSDNSLHYGMGFDEIREDDIEVSVNGVNVVIAPESADLLKDTTLDFVELEPGNPQFIFMNPNDPNYTPPKE